MLEFIDGKDKTLFLYLNQWHFPWLDPVMELITERYIWIPFYVLLLFYISIKYKWQTIFIIITIALVITISDQFASSFCKPFFKRLRPSHEPNLAGLVHLVAGKGGSYGFISSHAANTFSLATFLFLLFKKRKQNFVWIFIWAFVVSYSRIYIGVHYPADLFFGALSGMCWAYLVFHLYSLLLSKYASFSN